MISEMKNLLDRRLAKKANLFILPIRIGLTHFIQLFSFYIPWKH